MAEITFTLDLEHHWYSLDPDRFVGASEAILAMTQRLGVRGTVFVLGEVAGSHPDLVRAFASAGHEIALHGFSHTPLPELTEQQVRTDITRGKEIVEETINQRVVGYRAPYFSLTTLSRATVATLAELGFTYSSSVLPVANPQFGWPQSPAAPYVWPEGITELPVPVLQVRNVGIPFLGGTYLRVLPKALIRAGIRRGRRDQVLWTYCHPYDVDAAEPFFSIPRLGYVQSRLLWLRRGAMLQRLEELVRKNVAPPLDERVAAGIAGLVASPA